MLAHHDYAEMTRHVGELGTAAIVAGQGRKAARLYWHSVEFGLAKEHGDLKILGAGLASSFGDAHFSLEAEVPRPRFTIRDAAATPYRNDVFQPLYFVSDSLEEVAEELEALDIRGLRRLVA
jgi:phenylalanine-4-hydroxylase